MYVWTALALPLQVNVDSFEIWTLLRDTRPVSAKVPMLSVRGGHVWGSIALLSLKSARIWDARYVRMSVVYRTWCKTCFYLILFRNTKRPKFVPKTLKNFVDFRGPLPLVKFWTIYPRAHPWIHSSKQSRKNFLLGVFSFGVRCAQFFL